MADPGIHCDRLRAVHLREYGAANLGMLAAPRGVDCASLASTTCPAHSSAKPDRSPMVSAAALIREHGHAKA
jgi:hypothetical protein